MRLLLPTILLLTCILHPERKREHPAMLSNDRFPAMLTNGHDVRQARLAAQQHTAGLATLAAAERAHVIAERNYTEALREKRPVNDLARLNAHLFRTTAELRIAKESAGVA